jgi:hypothetical protein
VDTELGRTNNARNAVWPLSIQKGTFYPQMGTDVLAEGVGKIKAPKNHRNGSN